MIVTLNRYKNLQESLKSKKTVLTGGCFDLLHFGHVVFLREARKAGDYLIVAIESDKFIKTRKKRAPIHTQKQRAEILSTLRTVDLVIMLPYMKSDDDYLGLVRLIRPAVIAVTQGDNQMHNKIKQAEKIGAVVKVVTPLVTYFSSSDIIRYESILGR